MTICVEYVQLILFCCWLLHCSLYSVHISLQINAVEVVGEVVGNVGNCFRAQKHVQWQITNRQKLLALSSLDEGFN